MVAFVAEVSSNHLGSIDRALIIVDAAATAGATHVKFQTYEPSQMCEPNVIIQSGPWSGRNLFELYQESHTPKEWHARLFERARKLGMVPFSSAFHVDDVNFLDSIGCELFKISSFEILDLPLIRYAASKGKPMIISTGMATVDEVRDAGWAAFRGGCEDITFLKCTSSYPSTAADANLRTMFGNDAMAKAAPLSYSFSVTSGGKWFYPSVGISDHTLGLAVPVAATVLGASMIEKHLTLRRADGGPDAAFSSEPEEFATMVKACREAASAIGEVRYGPTESEMSSLPLRRKPGGKRGG